MEFEDFINDPMFVRWVSSPNQELDAYWAKVQADRPETKPIIAGARKLVLTMRFESEQMTVEAKGQLWKKIEAQTIPAKRPVLRLQTWLRTAAAIFLVGLIGLFYFTQQKIEISTEFGQRRTVELPDGSEVVLNANSTLSYGRFWGKDKLREVWIKGEAFFKVNHLHTSGKVTEGERFIVHADKLNVAVLGTSFNVNNRRGRIRVALLTGKVGLGVEGSRDQQLKLSPGELGEYQNQTRRLDKTQVAVADYLGWRAGRLNFHNTTLKEALLMIEDVYGYKSVLKAADLGSRKLSGSFLYTNSESSVFKLIAVSFGISIEKDKDTGVWMVDYKERSH
jgi:transmembrane sensor